MDRAQTPLARVVLLGASNVVFGFRSAVNTAREKIGGPVEVFAACGFGRAYGSTGNVFGRELPAIEGCGLWRELAQRPELPTFAVVTDVGIDIVFGSESAQIERWVEACVERLVRSRAQVVLTGLPLATLHGIPEWKFRFFSRLFFPQRTIDRGRALDTAAELDEALQRIARERGVAWTAPSESWYGHDPIHVRLDARADCWRSYVAPWNAAARVDGTVNGRWEQRGRLIAAERKLFGQPAGAPQPCASLADGTSFLLY